mmetsp:Transcript_48772/g.97300  ORF Transcript_48772/g.97300 Transcript_48772/m.97300 type:complete len:350 (+) Transcript_48772:1085-2134(+)
MELLASPPTMSSSLKLKSVAKVSVGAVRLVPSFFAPVALLAVDVGRRIPSGPVAGGAEAWPLPNRGAMGATGSPLPVAELPPFLAELGAKPLGAAAAELELPDALATTAAKAPGAGFAFVAGVVAGECRPNPLPSPLPSPNAEGFGALDASSAAHAESSAELEPGLEAAATGVNGLGTRGAATGSGAGEGLGTATCEGVTALAAGCEAGAVAVGVAAGTAGASGASGGAAGNAVGSLRTAPSPLLRAAGFGRGIVVSPIGGWVVGGAPLPPGESTELRAAAWRAEAAVVLAAAAAPGVVAARGGLAAEAGVLGAVGGAAIASAVSDLDTAGGTGLDGMARPALRPESAD